MAFKIDPNIIMNAKSWLFNSGIYILDINDPNYGAVYYAYDCEKRDHYLVYSEATGYVVSLLKYFYSIENESKFIDFAAASADWLIKFAQKYNNIIAIGLNEGQDIKLAYPFDNGICCKGFLDLYELTGNQKYLEYAEKIGEWLLNETINDDGSVKPELDLESGKFVESKDSWWKVNGSYHSKITMSLLQLTEISRKRQYRDAAMKVLEWTNRQQKPNGSFSVNKCDTRVNLHTHCYTLEALLYAYATQSDSKSLETAESAVNWMLRKQEQDGSLRIWYGDTPEEIKPSYAMAQFIRILSLLYMLKHDESFLQSAKRAMKFLLQLQANEPNDKVSGGFYEFAIKSDQEYAASKYKMSSGLPSWDTMFVLQAINFLERAELGNFYEETKRLF